MPESNDTPDGWSEAAAAKQSEALQGLRLQIDAVDRELLALLNRRASLSLEVGPALWCSLPKCPLVC